MIQSFDLEGPVPVGDIYANTFARGQRNHLVGRESALSQYAEHFSPHITGGTNDGDLETHIASPTHREAGIENPPYAEPVGCYPHPTLPGKPDRTRPAPLLVGSARRFNDVAADRLRGGTRGCAYVSCPTATVPYGRHQIVAFAYYPKRQLAANVDESFVS